MTISDIAKLAGVSSAAVSRYLNGGPLSEQKRAVIQAVVEKTGYSPDTAAQTLRTGKVRQVGVIVPSISSQSVGQITSGIAAELGASRYLMLLADTELDEQMELEYLTALQRNHVAGIILLGYDSSPQLCKALKDCRVPVVVTGQRFADLPFVYNDDRAAARDLTRKMLEHGRRNIVYIGGSEQERAETQLAQEQHKLNRLENRKKYLEKGERQKRTHRLCNLGGTVESLAPEVKDLTRTEMTELMEHIFSLFACLMWIIAM